MFRLPRNALLGPPPLASQVFEDWSTEHDAALLDAIWTAGFPSPRRPASDLACWRSAARHIAAAAPALASLSPLATDGEAGSEAAEVPADGGDGGVAAATRALSDRATQLCRAMLAYEREQSRDLAKEAEARERRRAEAEEKRRQREAAEEAKRLAREQKAREGRRLEGGVARRPQPLALVAP